MVDTEAKAIVFLTTARLEHFRTGSREICSPPVMDTDVDFVVYVEPVYDERVEEDLERAGFRNTSHDHADEYGRQNAPFETYRCGEVNLIVTWERFAFNNWRGATSIAKRMNLLNKDERKALFQGVLYCNWQPWHELEKQGEPA